MNYKLQNKNHYFNKVTKLQSYKDIKIYYLFIYYFSFF